LIRDVTTSTGQPQGVAVACQLATVLVDGAMTPTGPALLWQDRRASREAAELASVLDGRDIAIAGRRSAPELTAARLRWVATHEGDAWSRTRYVLSLKDYLVAMLADSIVTDATTASYSMLFDVQQRTWSEALGAAAAVPLARLPRVLAGDARAGEISTAAAASTGLRAGISVAVGGPDGSVAALGSGAVSQGVTVDVAGTTDVVLHTSARPIVDRQGRAVVNAYLIDDLWTTGGPTGLTGGAIAWLSEVLGYDSIERAYREIGAQSAALPPGAGGVTFHTALTGERFPRWTAAAAGSIDGLRREHSAAHVLRAAEEGGAFAVREGLDVLVELGAEIGDVRVSGGVTKRREALQLRADAWRRPVIGVSAGEATTVGTAILAAVAAGAFASIAAAAHAMVRLEPAILPDGRAADAYDVAFERWQMARGR
jgi:sugar (pentulose or hexulose) kinase